MDLSGTFYKPWLEIENRIAHRVWRIAKTPNPMKNKHQAVSQGVRRFGKRSPPEADEHLQ
jgi:hypothetical protein